MLEKFCVTPWAQRHITQQEYRINPRSSFSTNWKSVNDVQASLQKLEGRIQKLECSQTTANRDIENLTESFKAAEKQQQKSAASLEDHREKTSLALTDLQKANDDLQAKLKEIEDKNLYLEAYSRRENIIFENILQATVKEDTESVLRTFLETELGYKDANTVEIQSSSLRKEERRREAPTNYCEVPSIQELWRNIIYGLPSAWKHLQDVSRFTLRNSRKKKKADEHI